ncbi:MAG: hypothetical protein IJ158_09575 [Treponema sp.]|nr:hypothetical protein [Treponema sp.]
MKKILTIISVLALMAVGSSAFAEMNLAFHLGHDFSNFVWDGNSSDVSETNFGLTALKITDKNLALKWDVEGGAVHGDKLFNRDGGGGGGWVSFGLGKALARNEKMTLTLMPIFGFGFNMNTDEDSDNGVEDKEDKYEQDLFAVRMGVDVTGVFRLTKVLGIFTNLGLYYTVGSIEVKNKSYTPAQSVSGYEKTETDDSYPLNGWTFAPSIGVSLSFGN